MHRSKAARSLAGGALMVLLAASPGASPASAQQLDPPPPPADSGTEVRIVPGAEYEAGTLRRLLIGDGRRGLWTRELTVPVLDLDRFAGGLTPVDQGGNQSKTLHMQAADGRTFIFRSVDKFMGQVFPEDLSGTWVNDIAQDHVSVFHPGGSFIVPRLHEELGHLAIPPVYRVMPDDPRLGEYRETFAGMLGTMVERPNEGERAEALFAGSHRITGTDELFDKLGSHPRNQVAAREFLGARLVDFLVGDSDRGPDQWRWARVPRAWGFEWRPIVRDRDWAFMHADGVVPTLVRSFYPKLVRFDAELPSVANLTWADVGMGRSLLAGLDAAAWDSVVATVQAGLTDRVIREAVDRLPPEQQPDHAAELTRLLVERRGRLDEAAAAWYARLASDVDVMGTELQDRAEVVRREDGAVRVTLYAPAPVMVPVEEGDDDDQPDAEEYAADPYYVGDFDGVDGRAESWVRYYDRVFLPSETGEVRVYLEGGADIGVVRGRGGPGITVRLVGGEGTDSLYDAGKGSGRTALYDQDRDGLLVAGGATVISRRPFDPPEGSENFLLHKMGHDRHRDWGSELSWFSPALDYREGAGVVVGGGPTWTDYRFRSIPFGAEVSLRGLYALGSGDFGADLTARRHLPASPVHVDLHARASEFEAIRFYGYGNDTPRLPDGTSLIMQDQVLVELALGAETGGWYVDLGPVLRYTDPRVPTGNPAAVLGLAGSEPVTEAGAHMALGVSRVDDATVPSRGVRLDAAVTGFPAAGDAPGAYAGGTLELRGYVPLVFGSVLAARVGGRGAWGDFPIHGAATIGGQTTVRGFQWQRFAGDAAAYGSAELRVPLFRANLLLARGRLGVIGLTDAGRVWVDGASPGDWHTGYGGGLMFETLSTAVYALWARGDEDRVYVGLGMPF